MKNTGKRIFATVMFLALVNLPFIVMAGLDVTRR